MWVEKCHTLAAAIPVPSDILELFYDKNISQGRDISAWWDLY